MTVEVAEPLRVALEPLGPKIRAAFVFGSLAKEPPDARKFYRWRRPSSDRGFGV